MAKVVPRKVLVDACFEAIKVAERRHAKWTGGVTMRAAPESLVQSFIAQEVGKTGALLRLEASVRELSAGGPNGEPARRYARDNGRVDLAIYHNKAKTPRVIVEVKKINSRESLNRDHGRILQLMTECSTVGAGLLVGYTTAVRRETVSARIRAVAEETGAKIVREMPITEVTGRTGAARFLGAAVYNVAPPKDSSR